MFSNVSRVFLEKSNLLYNFMFVGMHLVFKQKKTFAIARSKPCGVTKVETYFLAINAIVCVYMCLFTCYISVHLYIDHAHIKDHRME